MLFESILAMLLSQPVYREDRAPELEPTKRAQLELIARAEERAVSSVKGWPGAPLELARLMNAVLRYETAASLRIHAGECRVAIGECDHGRARGPFQQQVTRFVPQGTWERLAGVDEASTDLAARVAAQALVRARASCRSLERVPGDWVRMTLASYAGRGCIGWYKGIELREAEFKRLGRFG